MAEITGKNWIGFSQSRKGDVVFRTINPTNNQNNPWTFFEANSEEIDQALDLAQQAFVSFSNTSDLVRAEFLRDIAQGLEALDHALFETFSLESGLPISRAKVELQRTCHQLRSFADFILEDNWRENVIERKGVDHPKLTTDLVKKHFPLGPVVVFGASNFPLAYSTAGGDTASALACGCPVIVKSHPMHAGTGEMVAKVVVETAQKHGLPEGVFSNLNSKGIEVGVQLLQSETVKAVGFTGSIRGGRALMDLAASRKTPIPVFAEMGSTNPVIFTNSILETEGEQWAKTMKTSMVNGCGQFCTNPGLIVLPNTKNAHDFIRQLIEELKPVEAQTMLHPNIKTSFDQLSQLASEQNGVEKLWIPSTHKINASLPVLLKTNALSFIQNEQLKHEVFGPYSLIITYENEGELIDLIRSLPGQLTCTLNAKEQELEQLNMVLMELQQKAGRLIFNGVPTGVQVTAGMMHGGPYPASSDSRFTAVGVQSIKRWMRPVSFQNFPIALF